MDWPDLTWPDLTYPAPIHFFVGLHIYTKKRKKRKNTESPPPQTKIVLGLETHTHQPTSEFVSNFWILFLGLVFLFVSQISIPSSNE